ncbi:lipase family protein [Candidatus Poriferisodalis sp.]|uniref:lipase family protein n=1 Tax=Candidatus Poriferisodalis sp. TaxID=3101277 RepID=UPI003B5A8B05
MKRALAVLLACAVVTAACSSDDTESAPEATAAPATTASDSAAATTGAPVVTESSAATTTEAPPPPTTEAQPHEPAAGDLLSAEPVDADGLDGWRVTYLSTGVGGDLVEVSGLVLAPAGIAAGSPIVTWAHGTTGVADVCAPSATHPAESGIPMAIASAGHIVAATDYEGLGTPGTHPYLVGESEGRGTIDIVRAVRQMDLGASDRYVVWGLSQGGHAALWTGQIAPSYAPELDLAGVVAAAPAANLSGLMDTVGTNAQGFAVMAAFAMAAAYDELRLEDYFSAEAIDQMGIVEEDCLGAVFEAFFGVDGDAMRNPSGWDGIKPVGPLAEVLAANEAGGAPIVDAPVLFVQGWADAVVAPELVRALHGAYCSQGTHATLEVYPSGGHVDTTLTYLGETLTWVGDRLAGAAEPGGCDYLDPDLAEIDAALATPAAVEGTLLEGSTPEGLDTLLSETTMPVAETCPGTAIFSGVEPVAFSAATWVRDPTTGPFLDVWAARFDSAEVAAQAIKDYDAELIACGEFVEPRTTALGAFSPGDTPELGDESYGHDYAGIVAGFPVNRYSVTARVGDTIYHAGFAVLFVDPDVAAVLGAINAILGL